LEPLGGLRGHPAPREVRPPGLAAPRIAEHLAIERSRSPVDLEHREALAARAPKLGRFLDARDGDPEPPGELLGDLDEALALELHQEREHVAVFLAAEAVEELLGRDDVERRCLLAVKWTQPLP